MRTYGGDGRDACWSVIQTDSGGFALAGTTESFGEGGSDCWLVQTEPDPVSVPHLFNPAIPYELSIKPTFPNPFNSTTTINYGLPVSGNINLSIYNPLGQQVSTLYEGNNNAGFHSTALNALDMPTGLYFIRLQSSDQVLTEKVMLIR